MGMVDGALSSSHVKAFLPTGGTCTTWILQKKEANGINKWKENRGENLRFLVVYSSHGLISYKKRSFFFITIVVVIIKFFSRASELYKSLLWIFNFQRFDRRSSSLDLFHPSLISVCATLQCGGWWWRRRRRYVFDFDIHV